MRDISAIVDDLYAGTMDDLVWNRAMVGIADLVSGIDALLLIYNPSDGSLMQQEHRRMDERALAEYRDYWIYKDIRLGPVVVAPVGEPQYEAKLMPLTTWRACEAYNDFFRRVDDTTFLCTLLQKSAARVAALSVQGTYRRGPFGQRDAELIRPLLPHVTRALAIRDRLRLAEARASTLNRCLDSSIHGIVVLDSTGFILESNAAASALMQSAHGVRRNWDGSLWLREPAGGQLKRWILAGIPPNGAENGLLHVPRARARPLSLTVARLPSAALTWFSGRTPCWLLLFFDPERQIAMSAELIACDLGISDRESEIAALLAGGYHLGDAAKRLNISIHTARSHLKAIYSKTGIRSQVELLRRILGGPAGIDFEFGK